ncbi:G-protein coupled receptor Mth2-like isoform X2 [Apis dorsata]|uniref:G-protein coupled receptor Mth2-like isoform X2 n=1 Tax=Apis dorsata TaxID=7462 RepID=UPI001293BE17|nr:G-protein coupled receptor Mth2-like isoform X2 [Apis dorsata]
MQHFYIIIRLFLFVLIYQSMKINGEKIEKRKNSCYPFPGIILDQNKINKFENGSIVYNKLVYPAESYQVFGNKTYGCICNLQSCLRKCCKRNEILGEGIRPNCTRLSSESLIQKSLILERNQLAAEIQEISKLSDQFFLIEDMQCSKNLSKLLLEPENIEEDAYVLQANGILQTSNGDKYEAWNYCLDWKEPSKKIAVLVCTYNTSTTTSNPVDAGIIISIPFFFATFFVYAIIPELRNLYGKTLMCYVACLVVAYTSLVLAKLLFFKYVFCSAIAFIIHFSFLASFFWLNVMCFDIWWTFGGFRSLHGSVKQRERKKFLIYSIYAWGCAAILTGICAIMDFLPKIPNYLIKPDFGKMNCWFTRDEAKAIYFYGPMGITVLCNICLFISTALKIRQHGKDTAQHLRSMDSRRHDDNKQWFNLYLKLFIVMGINWSMEIISWLCNNTPTYLWYLTDFTNTLQGVIIFIIFVWKDKVKRLLLRRFGCHGSNVFSRNSTRSGCRTCTSTTSAPSFQEKIVTYSNESFCDKTIVDN